MSNKIITKTTQNEVDSYSESLYEQNEKKVETNDLSDCTEIAQRAIEVRYRLFCGQNVRLQKDLKTDSIYFVADDICKLLGYKNTPDTIAKHCTQEIKKDYFETSEGPRAFSMIAEGDLYRLIFRSQKEEAKAFEKWVVEEVLPEIRKTQKYKVSRKLSYSPSTTATLEDSTNSSSPQVELFPRMLNVSFPQTLTEKLNGIKQKLATEGQTFPTNKDFITYIITRGLEVIE